MPERLVYLDHNATTPVHPEVQKVMLEAMKEFGNPSSMHSFGLQAKQMIENSRESIASFINSAAEDIIFVGSGSEANNTVFNLTSCPSLV
ncbi:MAG: aminotransferase class V-fold PLP-dependent enzyme, partial [Candidatus Omnitrophica bacterium]|nr:aminotransferase class V-fold PLP-dependent enzyme [Candidatus Omnitrophota bacterium]